MNEKFYCEHCDATQTSSIEEREESLSVRGMSITVNTPTRICLVCNQPVFDMNLDDQKLIAVYAQYRDRTGLLHPDEIRAIRQKYALSQSAAAKLLGWSPATFTRYETGSLQEAAHDEVLRRFRDDVNWVRELVVRNGHKLTDLQKRRLLMAMNSMEPAAAKDVESLEGALHGIYVEFLQAREAGVVSQDWALAILRRHAEMAGVVLDSESSPNVEGTMTRTDVHDLQA